MVPSFFVWLDAMPMTPNGKLDRKALPAPPREEPRFPTDLPPETKLEREIAEIWEDVLQIVTALVSDRIFSNSEGILSRCLACSPPSRHGSADASLLTCCPVALPSPGWRNCSAKDEPLRPEMDPVVALQPLGHLPPFFCVHGIGGDVLHLHRLALHMGTDRPFFGLRRTPEARLTDTINQIAARYVAAMLRYQPVGPFYLGGHSFGAMVAYEMALQLVKQGHEIGLLAIIDQQRPAGG